MWDWKEWAKAAGIRAIKTFAQTMVGSVAVGAGFGDIDWLRAASVAGVAAVLSLLTSLAGIPEVEKNELPDMDAEDN